MTTTLDHASTHPEAAPTEVGRSNLLDVVAAHVGRLEIDRTDCETRNGRDSAPERLSPLLDLGNPSRLANGDMITTYCTRMTA